MITITRKIHLVRAAAGKKRLAAGAPPLEPVPLGRIPRISRLMALAIKFDRLIRDGVVRDQSDLARLAHVTQPRMTQIMNLLHLAPAIQEELLFLPRVTSGVCAINEKMLRPLSAEIDWMRQQSAWDKIRRQPWIVTSSG